ncbi:hypothetical protein BG004_003697 [Podila humilis]|nr:hypothetical protein BG004_003697 [Podila humilis]
MDCFKGRAPKPKPPVAKPVLPMTRAEYEDIALPRVLIAGGGIAGLTLAILLHRAQIAVCVLERAKVIYPLGSMMAMGATIIPLFKQLGMYEEFMERSKPFQMVTMLTEDLEVIQKLDGTFLRDYVGQDDRIISRPELYTILRGNLPSHQIQLGKRVLSFSQTERGVDVRCSDNSLYHADIIVGADGAYSAIRQIMYKDPEVAPTIKAADKGSLPFKCVCLVGQTIPLDPEDFPHLDEQFAQSNSVLAETTMCTWFTVTTRENTVCWMMVHFMDKESYKRNDSFRTTEWGPESAEALAREVRDFRVPGGRDGVELTLGDYLDKTPARYLSKVVLEEIVFEKWYHKRAVLIGDACHKMNPVGGVGAMNAMHDAVTLANWLTTLRCPDVRELETAFEEYRKERYPVAKAAYKNSQFFRINFGKNMMASLVRVLIKRMPQWLWKRIVLSKYLARPQASFLPQVKDDAKLKPMAQQSLIKTLPILRKIVDDPAILFTDSPEVLAKAAALKEAEEKRAAAAIESGLVIHTPAAVDRSTAVSSTSPVAV